MNYKVTHICEPIYDISWNEGTVIGIYDRCFNVLTDTNQLITFFNKSDKFSTRAVLTDIDCSIHLLELSKGTKVFKGERSVTVGNIVFNSSHAQKIITKHSPIEAVSEYADNILLFADILEKKHKKSPIFEDGIIREKAERGFNILKTDLFGGFDALIGLGVGLTPSCDDMLAGMSAFFHLTDSGHRFNEALTELLCKKGDTVTTIVSKNLLSDCACGHINTTLYNVIHSILKSKSDIEKYTVQLIDVGSSSGSETCAGILIGYNFIKNKEQIRWL